MLFQVVLLSLAALSPSRAADLYVSAKGSDTNPGMSAEKPLLTLQKADSLVKLGDTVWVMNGVYRNAETDNGGFTSLLTVTHSDTPCRVLSGALSAAAVTAGVAGAVVAAPVILSAVAVAGFATMFATD